MKNDNTTIVINKNIPIKIILFKIILGIFLALAGAFCMSSVFTYEINAGVPVLLYGGMLLGIIGSVTTGVGILNLIHFLISNKYTKQKNNGKNLGVIDDLKNAFLQDSNTSLTAPSNPWDTGGWRYTRQNLERVGNFYARRRSDFSGNITTKTALKILLPLVVLFVVGFLVYTFFFFTV